MSDRASLHGIASRPGLLALAVALGIAGCGEDGDGAAERPGVRGALGGDARVTTLARAQLPGMPAGEAVWAADEFRLSSTRPLEHSHQPAFVYVRRGAVLVGPGGRTRLETGEAEFVAGGASHRLVSADGTAVVWEARLAPPGSRPPRGARPVFESEPLEGIPPRPLASLLEVTVPAGGGETTVHTHPGPEFIYQLSGRIEYQNALIGTKRLGPGGAEGIPPATAVQKRNPFTRDASFLSWFLVDPDEPFAPAAQF